MDKIVINGGNRLIGNLPISGSKNAVLPLMILGLLTDETLKLVGTPGWLIQQHWPCFRRVGRAG